MNRSHNSYNLNKLWQTAVVIRKYKATDCTMQQIHTPRRGWTLSDTGRSLKPVIRAESGTEPAAPAPAGAHKTEMMG